MKTPFKVKPVRFCTWAGVVSRSSLGSQQMARKTHVVLLDDFHKAGIVEVREVTYNSASCEW